MHRAFDDAEIFVLTRAQVVSWPLDSIAKAAKEECVKYKPKADVKRLAAAVQTASDQFSKAFDGDLRASNPRSTSRNSVLEFKAVDLTRLPHHQQMAGVRLRARPSRCRTRRPISTASASAYVLKRFFCDDLTPVGFEDPQEHVAGAHGSDTSCYACHYKLDPMAGFFRGLGAQFYDYSRERTIIFDDLADDNRTRYEATWRTRKGSRRKWNVGYVRSPRWENQNSYGETLADLSRIIREAPEPKRCLMKRLFEYMTAENQTIDGGYLDHLTEAFEREAAVSSSAAMKNAIVRIARAKTYHERNAEPQHCYDHAPDAKVARGPALPRRLYPAEELRAVSRHHLWRRRQPRPRRLDHGARRQEPHLPASRRRDAAAPCAGHDHAHAWSACRRTIPRQRMPKNKIMSSQERQELYLWAQQELSRIGEGGRAMKPLAARARCRRRALRRHGRRRGADLALQGLGRHLQGAVDAHRAQGRDPRPRPLPAGRRTWKTCSAPGRRSAREHAFQNGLPNSINIAIWHATLSNFAKSIGASCTQAAVRVPPPSSRRPCRRCAPGRQPAPDPTRC